MHTHTINVISGEVLIQMMPLSTHENHHHLKGDALEGDYQGKEKLEGNGLIELRGFVPMDYSKTNEPLTPAFPNLRFIIH